MSYRSQLSSMDKDTILFVRTNRIALAYHWDFYKGALAMISKDFINNPPSAVYYKVTDDPTSWVNVGLSMLDGIFSNKWNIPAAARASFAVGARLVKDMNVNIPNAFYVDAEGYEYPICMNDGQEEFVLRDRYKVGRNADITLEQYSISNPTLPFEQRHLMDDVKMKFNGKARPANSLMTFNSLMHPYYLDINDDTVAYIRNALRMSSYSSYDSDETSLKLPLNINVTKQPMIAPLTSAETYNGVEDFVARIMTNDSDTLLRILRNGKIQRSTVSGLDWTDCEIPEFIAVPPYPYPANSTAETPYSIPGINGNDILQFMELSNTVSIFIHNDTVSKMRVLKKITDIEGSSVVSDVLSVPFDCISFSRFSDSNKLILTNAENGYIYVVADYVADPTPVLLNDKITATEVCWVSEDEFIYVDFLTKRIYKSLVAVTTDSGTRINDEISRDIKYAGDNEILYTSVSRGNSIVLKNIGVVANGSTVVAESQDQFVMYGDYVLYIRSSDKRIFAKWYKDPFGQPVQLSVSANVRLITPSLSANSIYYISESADQSIYRKLIWDMPESPIDPPKPPSTPQYEDSMLSWGIDIFPIPGVANGWFAYKAVNTDYGVSPKFIRYCASFDNGATWSAYPYTMINPSCNQIMVLPDAHGKIVVNANVAGATIKYQSVDGGLNWFDHTIDDNVDPFEINYGDVAARVEFETSQMYRGSNHFLTKHWLSDPNKWCLFIKAGGKWYPSYAFYDGDIQTILLSKLRSILSDGDDAIFASSVNYAFHYDEVSGVIHVPFCANSPLNLQFKTQVSGQLLSTDNGSNWNVIYTTNNSYNLSEDGDSAVSGERAISFNRRKIKFWMDKWIICEPIIYFQGRYRVSSDFITWHTVDGLDESNLKTANNDPIIADSKNIYFSRAGGMYISQYKIPSTRIYRYDMRVKVYKWIGINTSQQLSADYIVWDDEKSNEDKYSAYDNETSTSRKPLKIGFPVNVNPNAFMLLYNGLPILNGSAYVNPENPREVIVENMQLFKAMQAYLNPVQFIKNRRDYIYGDFAIINFTAEDPTKECFMYCDRGFVNQSGKVCHVDFHSVIAGDCILFNGIDHEFIITGKKSIKYIISRYGLHEAIYPQMPYMYIGKWNIRTDLPHNVYKIQFILKAKK